MTLAERITEDPRVGDLLLGPLSHAEVARELGVNESAVRKWRKRHRDERNMRQEIVPPAMGVSGEERPEEHVTFSTADRQALHTKLDDLLTTANTDPASVKSMRVATWDGMIKNDLGQAEIVTQYGIRLESSRWSPAWPVVHEVAPVKVIVPERRPIAPKPSQRRWRTVLILPDIQAGYYRDAAGELHPTHDLAAIDIATQLADALAPDEILIGGDGLDLPEFAKFRLTPAFVQTTQAALDWAGQFLATLRGLCPGAKITWLAGNHEERLPNYILDNARAAYGLRRSDDTEGWPVLSVPHLCRFDLWRVDYVPGYPVSEYWFNDRIKAIHGSKVNSSGSTVHRYLSGEVSTVSFHIHRREWGERTKRTREGSRTIVAVSPGCLCRIDGAVPSTHGGTDLDGVPLPLVENWQHGVGVLHYEEGDGPFVYEQVAIHREGETAWALYGGTEVYSTVTAG